MNLETLFKGKSFFFIIFILVIILAVVFFLVIGFGKLYRGTLSNLIAPNKEQELPPAAKKKTVRKITIKRLGEEGCLEVTPEGVVRVYNICGEELKGAARLQDPKNIIKLFKIANESDLTKYTSEGEGEIYELTIETDTGTQVITIVVNNNSPGYVTDLIQTIVAIGGDLPSFYPTPSPVVNNPIPSAVVFVSPTPASSSIFYPSPTAIGGVPQEEYFTCDFGESSTKPYRISNVVCTSEPR